MPQSIDYNDVKLLSTSYFPPISYIKAIIHAESVLVEQHENFAKKTLRNRCQIYAANGVINLSVPIIKPATQKQIIKDTKIDYSINWQKQHFKSIESAYKSSPFYMYLIDDYMQFFSTKFEYLLDFNLQILQTVLDFLDVKPNLQLTDNYLFSCDNCEDLKHLTNVKNEDSYYSTTKPYYQVFADKHGFKPDLSIIDLLFCMGNEAYSYLISESGHSETEIK